MVQVTIYNHDLGSSVYCSSAYITFHDGAFSTSARDELGRICGSDYSTRIYTSRSLAMTVTFSVTNYLTGRGFSASYQAVDITTTTSTTTPSPTAVPGRFNLV